MNKSTKVMLSRLIILVGLGYQLYFIISNKKNLVSYITFLILAVGAFFTIESEENWFQLKITSWSVAVNLLLFLVQIMLFLFISFFAYKYNIK